MGLQRTSDATICGWNDVDSFVSIPNMLFNSFVISVANYSLLSDTMVSGNLYNFYTLSLNSLSSSFTDVSSVVAIKCIIFDNLLQTTRIAYFPATNSNFGMKSTVRCVHGFYYKMNYLLIGDIWTLGALSEV